VSRFIRILSLAVAAIVVMSVQLHAEDTSPPRHSIVLYVPAPSAIGDSRVTVAVHNLTDAATNVDLKFYDETGTRLAVMHGTLEPLGMLEIPEGSLPDASRLIAIDGTSEITGLVTSTWPDGSPTQIRPLRSIAGDLPVVTRSAEDVDTTDLIIVNIDTLQLREIPARQMEDFPALGQGPESRIAVLAKKQLSGGRLAYLAVDQGSLASKDPYPGSTVNIPFLCGGADTTNKSFCIGALSSYVPGKIHPALDIDKPSVEGTIRDNRIMATLPGTVVSTPSNVTCQNCTGWGNNVVVRHLLADGRVVHSGYGHFLYTDGSQAAGLAPDNPVVGAQFLGYKGNTGASDGSHLHFEIMTSINTFEGGYSPCSPHWTPLCINGVRTTAATGSTTTEDPAPYRAGLRKALLPYFSRTASVPSESNYDVYGVANRRLYGALPLTVQRSEAWVIAGRSETGEIWDIPLPSTSGFIKTGYRDDLASDSDGTDYRFYAYYNQMKFGGGYPLKLTMLPDSNSKIVDNDSLSGFTRNDKGADGAGVSDQIAGYYYSALVYEAHSGQYAKWQPNLASGTYKAAIHKPKMPYGTKAGAVRYKIYRTSTSAPILSDPIDHRVNDNQWVQLTANAGAVQSWNFDSTGYVGLSIDQSGGNDGIAPGSLVGVDAVKFLAVAPPALTFVTVSGPSSVTENTSGTYTATATFSDGTSSNVTIGAIWSENSSATTISTAGVLSAGSVSSNQSVTVTAAYTYNGVTKSGTKAVTIVDVSKTLNSVTVSGLSSINENASGTYTATATFSDGTSSNITIGAIWSENSSATTISTAGLLSAGSVSSTQSVTVTASYAYNGVTKSGTKTVTIVDVPKTLSSVTLSGPSSVNENSTGSYTATATFSDGSSSTVTISVVWSEDSSATTISSGGVLSAGSVSSNQSVTVTASYTYNGVTRSGTKAVTVMNLLTYTSSPSPGTYTSGGNVLKVKATFNGTNVTFTVAKQDGSAFTTSGVMTIRAGASYGCVANNNTYYWSYGSGVTTTTATFNLSQYFTLGSKDLFAAIGRPSTYCDGIPPTYYSGKLTITAQ